MYYEQIIKNNTPEKEAAIEARLAEIYANELSDCIKHGCAGNWTEIFISPYDGMNVSLSNHDCGGMFLWSCHWEDEMPVGFFAENHTQEEIEEAARRIAREDMKSFWTCFQAADSVEEEIQSECF